MAGHVSKASDVYAYGILLYEIITGSRAYAGVPIPLLPHEVAMQRLRPQWPKKASLAPSCQRLRELAEACWTHKAQDRCATQPEEGVGSCDDAGKTELVTKKSAVSMEMNRWPLSFPAAYC